MMIQVALMLVTGSLSLPPPVNSEEPDEISDAPRVLVLPFQGTQASAARAAVYASLRHGKTWHVVDLRQTDDMMRAVKGDTASVDLPDLTDALRVKLVVSGRVEKNGTRVQVLSGKSGALILERTYPGKLKDSELAEMVHCALDGRDLPPAPQTVVLAKARIVHRVVRASSKSRHAATASARKSRGRIVSSA